MKEEYHKISLLRFRNKITTKDVSFIKEMHEKYCSFLKKNICWQCPQSIREAMFDLLNYTEKNTLPDETDKTITEQRSTEIRETSEPVPAKKRGRKPSTSVE